jgi:hypothetical protein
MVGRQPQLVRTMPQFPALIAVGIPDIMATCLLGRFASSTNKLFNCSHELTVATAAHKDVLFDELKDVFKWTFDAIESTVRITMYTYIYRSTIAVFT